MQLFFIRHGQSANNLLYATTGSNAGRDCDPELTRLGYQQAELLADYLQREEFNLSHLYTSLMVRSVATGSVVADRLGLELKAWPDLHEEGGIYLADDSGNHVGQPGKDRSYFENCFPKLTLPGTVDSQGWWNRPYEEVNERPVRARRFLQDLIAGHGGTDDRVAVISHGGFYNQVLNALLGLPPKDWLWFTLYNTAITRIDFKSDPDRIDVVYHNFTHFLHHEYIT